VLPPLPIPQPGARSGATGPCLQKEKGNIDGLSEGFTARGACGSFIGDPFKKLYGWKAHPRPFLPPSTGVMVWRFIASTPVLWRQYVRLASGARALPRGPPSPPSLFRTDSRLPSYFAIHKCDPLGCPIRPSWLHVLALQLTGLSIYFGFYTPKGQLLIYGAFRRLAV
jgi:hypothetical protein